MFGIYFDLIGKYSDEPNPADEWFKKGKIVCFSTTFLIISWIIH